MARPQLPEMSERCRDHLLARSRRDPRHVNFVPTLRVRLAGRDIEDEIVAVAGHESVREIGIRLEREPELDERLAGQADDRDLTDPRDADSGGELAALRIDTAIAQIDPLQILDRTQRRLGAFVLGAQAARADTRRRDDS